LLPNASLSYFIGGATEIFQKSEEAELVVGAEYQFSGRTVKETFAFFIGDLNGSAVLRSNELEALKRIADKIDKVTGELSSIRQALAPFLPMVDATGLRLSQRTVASFRKRGKKERLRPDEFSGSAYRLLLNISRQESSKLARIFDPYYGAKEDWREEYMKLPQALRKKFERLFNVDAAGV
jgi:hypothetical protein